MSANLERFAGMSDSKRYLIMTEGELTLLVALLDAGTYNPVFTDDITAADVLRELGVCNGDAGGRNYTLSPSALSYGEDLRITPRRSRPRIPGVNEFADEI
jgi:hypothetical protein